ncbi:MAG: ATP-binding protein [Planctomycetota bacterium]
MPTAAPPEPITPPEPTAAPVLSSDDLADVFRAYSAVSERLQASHEALQEEVARLHTELAAKNAQLERSKRLAALGEMAAGIAHEVRNPLAAIQLYAELIGADLQEANHDTLAPAADHTRKIADAVRGLSGVVQDVLSFAQTVEPQPRTLDAAEVLQRVVDEQRPGIESRRIEVVIEVKRPRLHADPDLLHRALVNLVRNAVEAVADREERRLTLTADAGRLTVADTGPGLPAGVADRIFNPFFTTRSTGTGLGLAIVHRIVDAHGGAVSVTNDARHGGAIFTLELPLPQAACGLASPPGNSPLEPAA